MSYIRPKFKEGEYVIHTLLPRRPMVVVQNKTKLVITDRNFSSETIFTGKVICSWADENEIKKDEFSQQELEPINRETMTFSALETDNISVLRKKDGEVFSNLKASVQGKKIYMTGTILIQSGDIITHSMSNGSEDTYEVVDPGFHEKFLAIPAGYQMTVRKLGLIEAEREKTIINNNYNYNFEGNNNRVNNNSVDSSTNIIHKNTGSINEHLEKLQYEIEKLKISAVDKQDLVDLLEALGDQIHSDKPKISVIKTIIGTLSTHGAEIASIGSFILQLVQPASA
ncbi:hypothetical protein [Dyadobacter sp. CY323]|uniref:hypothetical protein n=1 Tax=Dyadobacter sp. CY323 TaxID=2907302 RepID=UPI001F449B9C|nr:hypothetical protein [Dyadobacter sp. CY323]MCE6993187.1 hypothetical protein [Dyadobacter sp. CY323]